MAHVPVLLKETIELLNPQSGEFFIDGTLGEGGHAAAILERILPNGKLLAIDQDEDAVIKFQLKIKNNVILINDNFMNIATILKNKKLGKANGVLLDLGFSSGQLTGGRGFSFLRDEPLLMTYKKSSPPLKSILKNLTENEIREIIKNYGEERFAGRIARAIVEQEKIKPLETSLELAETVKNAVPRNYERGRLHPATRTFLAFRIYINRELENLEIFLDSLEQILAPKARVGIISFNSLEDRMIKHYFRAMAKRNILKIITKKPVRPAAEEINSNPRSRSAKLRAALMA
ncbi:MAG: 16S rRNA (cytosine(1402)-N(4))-methyltransferase RsmH [Patescibacteria group bacterium]